MNNIKQCYNWDTNILDFNDKYGNHYYLQLRGNKNIIKGSSGTGKTYLYKKLSKLKQKLNNISNYDIDNILLLNKDNLDKLGKTKNKLIIIDNADLLLNNNAIDIINMDDDNRYLIFTRVPLGIEISPNHQAEFVKEDNKTILKYRFNVKGWS